MKTYWIKLYIELLNDPKTGPLNDHIWRRMIELFLLAGQMEDGGKLPEPAAIAWTLRTTEKDIMTVLETLQRLGIAEETPAGWIITNFQARQDSHQTDAEKARKQREKKRAAAQQTNTEPSDDFMDYDPEQRDETTPNPVTKRHSPECQKTDKPTPEKVTPRRKNDTLETDKDKEAELKVLIPNGINTGASVKPTPNDAQYWDAFREESERARIFYAESRIAPASKEFGRWQNDLREMTRAGITIPAMVEAIRDMRRRGLTIGAPGSVFKTARDLQARPAAPARKTNAEIIEAIL